jgi:hypothetical protein
MEPEGSIPNSQELSTCPYPDPDQSSPHDPIQPLQILPNIIHPPMLTFWTFRVEVMSVYFKTVSWNLEMYWKYNFPKLTLHISYERWGWDI